MTGVRIKLALVSRSMIITKTSIHLMGVVFCAVVVLSQTTCQLFGKT
jgi:hypothetical protein